MTFITKQFDIELLIFNYIDEGVKGQRCEIVNINEDNKHLLPIRIHIEKDDAIMSWLKKKNHS